MLAVLICSLSHLRKYLVFLEMRIMRLNCDSKNANGPLFTVFFPQNKKPPELPRGFFILVEDQTAGKPARISRLEGKFGYLIKRSGKARGAFSVFVLLEFMTETCRRGLGAFFKLTDEGLGIFIA